MEERKRGALPAVLRLVLAVAGVLAILYLCLIVYAAFFKPGGSTVSDIPFCPLVYDYSYNADDRVVEKITSRAEDGVVVEREEVDYDGDGLVSEVRMYYNSDDGDDWYESQSYQYDREGRLAREESYMNFSEKRLVGLVLYEYNELEGGGVERIERSGLDVGNYAGAPKDAYGRSVYDSEGYLVSSESVVDGEVVERKTYERPVAPRIDDVAVKNPIPATSYSEATRMGSSNVLGFDGEGNVESVTLVREDGKVVVRERNAYDGNGRIVRKEYPAQGAIPACVRCYLYDDEGRLVRETLGAEI